MLNFAHINFLQGQKDEESLVEFAASQLSERWVELWAGNLASSLGRGGAWLVVLCPAPACLPPTPARLLSAALEGVARLGLANCKQVRQIFLLFFRFSVFQDSDVCSQLGGLTDSAPSLVFLPAGLEGELEEVELDADWDHKEILTAVLSRLPALPTISQEEYNKLLAGLEQDQGPAWLLLTRESLQLRRLPGLLPRLRVGVADCSTSPRLCSELGLSSQRGAGLLKLGGVWELSYGGGDVEEIVQVV